jgi:hypothetical protein
MSTRDRRIRLLHARLRAAVPDRSHQFNGRNITQYTCAELRLFLEILSNPDMATPRDTKFDLCRKLLRLIPRSLSDFEKLALRVGARLPRRKAQVDAARQILQDGGVDLGSLDRSIVGRPSILMKNCVN